MVESLSFDLNDLIGMTSAFILFHVIHFSCDPSTRLQGHSVSALGDSYNSTTTCMKINVTES